MSDDRDYALDANDARIYPGDRVRFLGDCEGTAPDGVVDRLHYEPYAGLVWGEGRPEHHVGLIDEGLFVRFDDGQTHHVYASDLAKL